MATTRTNTNTYTRNICIKNQFKTAFQRIMGYSEYQCKKYLDAIQNQKIKSIEFWAYTIRNDKKLKTISLRLCVDWNQYNSFVIQGKDQVVMRSSWGECLPEISEAISNIEDTIIHYNYTPTFSVRFNSLPTTEYNHYMSVLNLVSSSPVEWDPSLSISDRSFNSKELEELTATLSGPF